MQGCRALGNALGGIDVSAASFLDGTELTISNNGGPGLHSRRASTAFCLGCTLAGNAGFAGSSTFSGLLTLLDSTVSGTRGISATLGGYADVDCGTEATAFPCSLTVTQRAVVVNDATAALLGTGDFSGQLIAAGRGQLVLIGARQLSTGQAPNGSPLVNFVESFGTLEAASFVDELEVVTESKIRNTDVAGFGRALLRGATVVDGAVTCDSAGDAWADAGVVLTPGSSITGCEHASTGP